MSHMVIYRSADGKAGFRQVDDLTAAVAFVEKIRNSEGVENSRIYRMEQVNYRFEPYYQVRLESGELLGGPYAADPASAPGGAPSAPPAPAPAPSSVTAPVSSAHASFASVSGPATSTGSADVPASNTPSAAATSPPSASPSIADTTTPAPDPPATTDPGDGNGIRRGLFR